MFSEFPSHRGKSRVAVDHGPPLMADPCFRDQHNLAVGYATARYRLPIPGEIVSTRRTIAGFDLSHKSNSGLRIGNWRAQSRLARGSS